jgi:hypothetical protein
MTPPDAAPGKTPSNLGAALSLEGRVNVFPDAPLPEFDSVGGPAFVAQMRNDTSLEMMAIICTTGLPSRSDLVNTMRVIDNPSILRLRECGVLHWPSKNAHCYALAYDRPAAPRYRQSLDEVYPPMGEDMLNHFFLSPMASALMEFQRTGIVHGSIQPANIFWRDGSTAPPQLCECLSAPAGISQPVLFETIERAMSQPVGRGPGSHPDDCYALGVTLVLLMLGQNPLKGMNDQAILQAKLEHGSFNVLVGSHRLPTTHLELLRGLLTDDPKQRMTATEIEQWLTGRRFMPTSSDTARRANRHFTLGGKEYWQVRTLSAALAAHINEAVQLIEDNTLGKWLTRSLGDEERAKNVDEAIRLTKEGGKAGHYEDQLVARVCIALDPAAPIRYRSAAVLPDGVAPLLAEAMLQDRDMQVPSEIIANQFATFWLYLQKELKPELVPQVQLLERMCVFLEKTGFGNGVERVAYELNPSLPCLSPMLRMQYVLTVKRVLPALEHVATLAGRPKEPMDRHLAAFLVVRDKKSEILFSAMSSPEGSLRRGMALLTLFSEMQCRYGPDQLPALAAWLIPAIEPGIRRFLSKPYQEKVRRQVKEAVNAGNLSLLLQLVDDPKCVDRDEQDFLTARQMYRDIQEEIADIEANLKHRNGIVQTIGRPIAVTIASFLSILFIAFTVGRALWHHLG